MINTIITYLSSNAFLSGGAILGAAGILFAYLRTLPQEIWGWIKRRFIIEIDIPDRDEAFKWMDEWLSRHNYQKRCRLLTVHTKRQKPENCPADDEDEDYRKARPEVKMSPAPGTHYFFYKRRLIILHRDRKDGSEQKSSLSFGFRETFNIKIFSRSRKIIADLFEEARNLIYPPSEERVSVFVPSYGSWMNSSKKLIRPIESVVLDGNLSEYLLEDIKEFQQSEKWYSELGIPYRRGYLLYGPPGNGKSSLVMAVASELSLDICVLNLNTSGLSDDRLTDLMLNLPHGAVVLIEDVDCALRSRENIGDKEVVTLSGLLNCIDGVMAGEGRILFMTTNYKDKLDPALIRPGRCDVQLSIGQATSKQAEKLFLRFFPDNKNEAELFGSRVKDVSMATLQGHLIKYRKDAEECLKGWV